MDRDMTEPEGDAMPKGEDREPVILLNSIEDLRRRMDQGERGPRLGMMPVRKLKVIPSVFQPRPPKLVESHVGDLRKVLRDGKTFDPLLVMRIGPDYMVIDGHHRIEAARRSGKGQKVPVVYFEGTVDEAVLEAGRANSKATLNMPSQERQDFAWRLVCHGLNAYKVREITDAAGISRRQVQIMRKVFGVLEKREKDPDSFDGWWQAHQAYKGANFEPMDDDEMEAKLQANIDRRVDSLRKAWGDRMPQNPELSARVLAAYYGDRLDAVMQSAAELDLIEDPREWDSYDDLDDNNDF